jgi:malonyl-CoA/methylmalonyl-CoA synthetase
MNPLVELLLGAGRANPRKVAVSIPDQRDWTYQDLERLSSKFCHRLIELNVIPGDRVAVQSPKSAELIALNIAVARIGAVYVPINDAYTFIEVSQIIQDSRPNLFVCQEPLSLHVQQISISELVTSSQKLPDTFDDVERSADDLATILYTSGTTGKSKGAMLTHGNLDFNARGLVKFWDFNSEDVLLHILPIFHIHGLFVAMHCAFAAGSTLLLMEKFDPKQAIEGLSHSTVFMGVPTHYIRLLAEPDFNAEATKSIRLFVSGSAPMLEAVHLEFLARTGQRILERYGMTETCMIASNPYRGERRIGTVGPALPGVSVRIAEAEPHGIEVKGPNVFKGYWNLPDLTELEFTEDGWFKTGDLGTMDGEDYISISGRAKDLIITGGLNVYPKEIEMFLDAIPGVSESAVIGVPDPDFGEAVVAVVVLQPSSTLSVEEIRFTCRQGLAGFKIPKRFEIVEALPRNLMGKVQKNILRDINSKGGL